MGQFIEQKTLEMMLIGAGLGLQGATYYLKYYRPVKLYFEGKKGKKTWKKDAAISHAMGYPPSITAKICLGIGGYMYLKDRYCSDYSSLFDCLFDKICK